MIDPGTLIAVLFLTTVLFVFISALLTFKLRREKEHHRNTQEHMIDFMSSNVTLRLENASLQDRLEAVTDSEETHS